ncbi:MAG TPA: beta-ribofuranosylaminobenzene 5'-phosphate synthase family protein [Gemmatimonadaceae bacterium]|nr:beta-ribofuranosylaminobenzene 5'-phosphate synthase family protein [Gemmatimonadaceae bacterium]
MAEHIVRIEAPARLHFGMLDLRGSLGRRFGGIGAGVFDPSLVVEIERAPAVEAEGAEADRAAAFARRYLESQGIRGGARIAIRHAIPEHAGLGSGTQLALAVARGIAELYDRPTSAGALAAAVGRGRRSAIGTWLFESGGFIVEGGRREDEERIAPLLVRLPIPDLWRCVVAVPWTAEGVSGESELQAFRELPPPPLREVEHVAHLVLMSLLPALVEGDLAVFGETITTIQQINGSWFAPAQGGTFASGPSTELISKMREHGAAAGVGQSSWGPAVYAITEGDDRAAELASSAGEVLNGSGMVYVNQFARTGARVTSFERQTPRPTAVNTSPGLR